MSELLCKSRQCARKRENGILLDKMDQKRNIISETKRENIISKGPKNILLRPGGPSMVTWTWSSYNLFFEPISAVVLFNLFFLFILYSTDHTLRHQATFTLRRILGYHEENVIYEKVIQGKAIGMKYTSISRHVVMSCFLKILLTTIM